LSGGTGALEAAVHRLDRGVELAGHLLCGDAEHLPKDEDGTLAR
jgi:hypothetical protein